MTSVSKLLALPILAGLVFGQGLPEARKRYQRTDYEGALAILARLPESPEVNRLRGQALYGKGEFQKAAEAFESCLRAEPNDSPTWNWLGRARGRQAETANPLRAPFLAGKAREAFETAVRLEPSNLEAVNDLFSYYLEAPGFLGGGLDKAEQLAREKIKPRDEAEYESALAQVALARKQYDVAERHLRQAAGLAAKSAGKLEDLALFLARRGRHKESDQEFQRARQMDPSSAGLVFRQAEMLVAAGREPEKARGLLEEYLRMPRTPDDPPAEAAYRLLRKIETTQRGNGK